VKEIVDTYNAYAKLKHFFKYSARNFKLVKMKAAHAIKTACYTNVTATTCNSTPVILVLRKTTELRYMEKEWNKTIRSKPVTQVMPSE
jgi:hypothetical protein